MYEAIQYYSGTNESPTECEILYMIVEYDQQCDKISVKNLVI